MPPKYYVFIDGAQKGPYSLDQLKDIGIHPSTYVWSKEMSDWERADSVEEIRNLFRGHIERSRERETQTVAEPTPAATPPSQNESSEGKERRGVRRGAFYFPETEETPDLSRPPQVSMTLAILSLLLCFPPTGIAAVIFTYKATKSWEESLKPGSADPEGLRRKAHDYERLAKMWMGLTVAFGIIFWTLIFSIPK